MARCVQVPCPDLKETYEAWLARAKAMHPAFDGRANRRIPWTPVTKPLAQSTVALVSTAGVHRRGQPPFDLTAGAGDWSFRVIDRDVPTSELMASHAHYDTARPNEDINVVFPLDILKELAAEGRIARVAPRHFGMMGFIPKSRHVAEETGPALAAALLEDGVDVCVLSPG